MKIYTVTVVSSRNVTLFLIISLVVIAVFFNNNPFSSFDNIKKIPYQTALAIPNVQTNNSVSRSASNDTKPNIIPTVNHPPVANAGINLTVNENTSVTLNGIAIDPDPNNMLSYSWLQVAGPEVILSNNNTTNPSFIAPGISSDTALKFSLTAKDDKGALSSPSVITVIVKAVNQPPIANAGPDQMVNLGHVISLDGTKSKDPDDDPITYSWEQIEGPGIKLNGADTWMATFTAPTNNNISSDTDLIFKLTVADSKNATSIDNVKITLKYSPPPNHPPIANAGADQTVNSGDIVTLDGTASKDPEGSLVSYIWRQIEGPSVTLNAADTASPSFTAPTVSSDTALKFSVTAKDDKSDTSFPAIVTINVKHVNAIPVANDQSLTTSMNQPVNIQLSASDKDNDNLTRQILSPPSKGRLSDFIQNTGDLTYTPNPGFSGTDSFMFKVNDGKVDSNAGTVGITVNQPKPISNPPVTNQTGAAVGGGAAANQTGDTLMIPQEAMTSMMDDITTVRGATEEEEEAAAEEEEEAAAEEEEAAAEEEEAAAEEEEGEDEDR